MKPLLAIKAPAAITFPVLGSPKIDGIRALVIDGRFKSRSLRDIPNEHAQSALLASAAALQHFDGELVVGSPTAADCMQASQSGLMSKAGAPDFCFYVFDHFRAPDAPFEARLGEVRSAIASAGATLPPWVQVVEQVLIASQDELDAYEQSCLSQGYEGVMIRAPGGRYKFGRSTAREGLLMKVKRFDDAEAVIVGVEELMHNDNEATADPLGHTQRSTLKAGLTPAGTLGAIVCRHAQSGVEFRIGTGYTAAQRAQLWQARAALPGQLAKYKHFAITGTLTAPRFPVFLGLRSALDM